MLRTGVKQGSNAKVIVPDNKSPVEKDTVGGSCRDADKKFSIKNQSGGFPSPELARAFKPCGRGGGRAAVEDSAVFGGSIAPPLRQPAARNVMLCVRKCRTRDRKNIGGSLFLRKLVYATLADKNKGQRHVHSHTQSHTRDAYHEERVRARQQTAARTGAPAQSARACS